MISAELGKPREQFISDLVASGRYGSKSEVLREGVRRIQEREARCAVLDAAMARSLEDAEAGRTQSAEAVFDRLEAKYAAMAKTTA